MTVYVDANVVVALLIQDGLSSRAQSAVAALAEPIVISDVVALEFASAVARRVRSDAISTKMAREAFSDFDLWVKRTGRVELSPSDIAAADAIVRRLDINLHGADAIHAAMAQRIGAALLTFDDKMRANAKKLGLTVM